MKQYDIAEIKTIDTPTPPSVGFLKVYAKSDNKLYILNAAGDEIQLGIDITPDLSLYGSYNYVVNDDTERLALTGMTVGDTVFQKDTAISYIAISSSSVEPAVPAADITHMGTYDYIVTDETERLALTGMTIGKTIFQKDTAIIYSATSSTTCQRIYEVPNFSNYGFYNYVVNDDAERLALTGMTIGQTIFQKDTGKLYIATSPAASVLDIDSSKIAKYDYVVSNSTERLALTGMTIGQTIFQKDTGKLYIATSSTVSKIDLDNSKLGIYDYVVEDEAGRLALTGIAINDTIFVKDTGIVYISISTIGADSKLAIGGSNGIVATVASANEKVNSTSVKSLWYSATLVPSLKKIKINAAGSVRVSFDMGATVAGSFSSTQGQIYKNGVAVGTLRNQSNSSSAEYITYTEDFTVNVGDIFEVYGRKATAESGINALFKNLKISYDPVSEVSQVYG